MPSRTPHTRARWACWALTAAAAASLLACSSSPKEVPQRGAAVPGSAPGPVYGATGSGVYAWTPAMAQLHDQLGRELGGGVTVSKTTDERLWITLPGDESFEANRSALKPAARTQLDKLAARLRAQPLLELRIVGHTDAKGATGANNALSLDRAASTRDWLVARGLSPERIAVAGRGAAAPVASNDSESGRANNRRVEILVGERHRR